METIFAATLFLCQIFSDPVRGTAMAQTALKQQTTAQERVVQDRQAQARREFERQFNKLVTALSEFTAEYNRGRGDVWPAKQADALKKAIRDLQRSGLDSNK
jgi:hypothetical protein